MVPSVLPLPLGLWVSASNPRAVSLGGLTARALPDQETDMPRAEKVAVFLDAESQSIYPYSAEVAGQRATTFTFVTTRTPGRSESYGRASEARCLRSSRT